MDKNRPMKSIDAELYICEETFLTLEPTGGYQNLLRIHLRLIQAAPHLRWNHVLHS